MRCRWLSLLLCLALVALFSPSMRCLAWEARADQHADAPGHEAGGKGHAPGDAEHEVQPSVFEGTLDMAIWTIVVFLFLVFVLGKYAWRPMIQGLEQRELSIRAAAEEARQAREEAQRLREEFQ